MQCNLSKFNMFEVKMKFLNIEKFHPRFIKKKKLDLTIKKIPK
jgi:hypothetical protein